MMNRSRAGASLTPASVSRLMSQLPNVALPKMPATVSVWVVPFWNVTSTVEADRRTEVLRRVLVEQHFVRAQAGDGPVDQVRVDELVERHRIDGADRLGAAVDLSAHLADGGHRVQLRHRGEGFAHRRRQALEPLVGDDVVGGRPRSRACRPGWRRATTRTPPCCSRAPRRSSAPTHSTRSGEGIAPTLSRARTPGTLNSFATGHPIILVTGLAIVDDRLAMPRNSSSAPVPASPTSPTVPPGRTNSPMRNSEIPTTVMITPATSRRCPQCGEAELGPHGRHRRDLRRSTSAAR